MKLTNGEIFLTRESLATLMEQKLPLKAAYGLAQLSVKLEPQLKVIDEVRKGLIRTYGESDPDRPRQIRIVPGSEGFEKFAAEMNELLAQEVEIVIKQVELPEDGGIEVEPKILAILSKFITVKGGAK